MTADTTRETHTEAVARFDDADSLQGAIDDLLSSGFDRAEISLLASESAVDARLGHLYEKVGELEDDPEVPRSAYISRESVGGLEGGIVGGLTYLGAVAAIGAVVASGGTLLAAVSAAAVAGGASAALGSLLARLVGEQQAGRIEDQLRHGGLLLWVRTRDAAHEQRATKILKTHSAHDVHTHELPALTF